MPKKEKSDEEIRAEINRKINKRLDHVEALIAENEELHALRIQLKDSEIARLKRQITALKKGNKK